MDMRTSFLEVRLEAIQIEDIVCGQGPFKHVTLAFGAKIDNAD